MPSLLYQRVPVQAHPQVSHCLFISIMLSWESDPPVTSSLTLWAIRCYISVLLSQYCALCPSRSAISMSYMDWGAMVLREHSYCRTRRSDSRICWRRIRSTKSSARRYVSRSLVWKISRLTWRWCDVLDGPSVDHVFCWQTLMRLFYNARQCIGSESKIVCTSQKPRIVHVECRLLKSS